MIDGSCRIEVSYQKIFSTPETVLQNHKDTQHKATGKFKLGQVVNAYF